MGHDSQEAEIERLDMDSRKRGKNNGRNVQEKLLFKEVRRK